MKNSKYFLLFGCGIFVVLSAAWASEINITNPPAIFTPIASPTPSFSLLERIQAGMELLKKSPVLAFENKVITLKNGKKLATQTLNRKQVALAVLNLKTGELVEKRVWVKEDEIKNYRKTKRLTLTPVDPRETLNLQPLWWNSFNTNYEVVGRPDLAIVANKYLMPSEYLTGLPEKSKTKYTNIIYAPYSKAIHTDEIVAVGKSYLQQQIDAAFRDLDNRSVRSRSNSSQLATAGVTKEFVKNIALVEHVDPDGFVVASDGGKTLTERVLVIVGSNQELAYRYTGSPAGANGLAQFIKPTYKTIVGHYPSAQLIKDYLSGMGDHVNAVKAMVLFFDAYKNELNNKIIRKDVLARIGITEEMLAAAYNGGPNRVSRSVNEYGIDWLVRQFGLASADRVFRTETLNYLKKFQSIRELDLF